jgi:hypothetical protein
MKCLSQRTYSGWRTRLLPGSSGHRRGYETGGRIRWRAWGKQEDTDVQLRQIPGCVRGGKLAQTSSGHVPGSLFRGVRVVEEGSPQRVGDDLELTMGRLRDDLVVERSVFYQHRSGWVPTSFIAWRA